MTDTGKSEVWRGEPRMMLAIPKKYTVESELDDTVLLALPVSYAGPLGELIVQNAARGKEMMLQSLKELYRC